ncbi:MAG: hypothetical protein EOP92_42930, partial [Lysobacteraceae bacterium]
TPGVLTRAIAQLRAVLEDDVQQPRYIQTRHALGYRFIGQLETTAPADPADHPAAGEGGQHASPPAPSSTEPSPVQLAMAEQAIEEQAATGIAAADGEAPVAARDAASAAERVETHDPLGDERSAQQAHAHMHRWWIPTALLGVMVAAASLWNDRSPAGSDRAPASIAVMPFVNLGKDRDDDYFAEGLALEMHDALAGVQGLTVAAEMSPAAAANREADVKALGKRLGVATVLDASVRREGARVRISARLSDTATGYTLWSKTYDHQVDGVFATQTEIAEEVVRSLLGAIPGRREALARRLAPTRNVAAFDAYLRGLQQLRLSAVDGDLDHAIGLFKQALAADGRFALAQAGICRSELFRFEALRDAGAYARALESCGRAEKMDPGLDEVALAMGNLHHARGEFDLAIAQYARAEASPASKADAYLGMAKAYAGQDRQEQARDYFERARKLRPDDASLLSTIGYWQYSTNHLD